MSQKLEGAATPAPHLRTRFGLPGRRAIGASLSVLLLLALPIGSRAAQPSVQRGLGLNYDLAKARAAMARGAKLAGAAPKELNDYFNTHPYSTAHPPMNPVMRNQPDGYGFPVRVQDIGEGGGQETLDGYLVVQGKDGWWRYATWGTKHRFEPTRAIVGRDTAPASAKASHKSAALKAALAEYNAKREEMRRYLAFRQQSIAAAAAAAGQPVVVKIPILLFKVNNQDFQPDSMPEKFKKMFDGKGTNPNGTVTELYLEQSFGKMVVQFDAYGPFTQSISNNPVNDCWYGTDNGPVLGTTLGLGGYGSKGMALEAVPQADPTVDFSQYDNDGDNYVDFLMVLHSGPGAEATGNGCDVHSHYFAGLGPAVAGTPSEPTPPTTDGVLIGAAMTVPEIDVAIGVVAHEFMHALGEPDYYGTAGTEGTGEWDLGAAGPWLGVPAQTNPVHFNPVMKVNFGWVKPRMIESTTRDVALKPRESEPDLVMIPTRIEKAGSDGAAQCDRQPIGGKPHQNVAFLLTNGDCLAEGFLLENFSRNAARTNFADCVYQSADFDRQAYASGLLIWYWDFTNYRQLGNNNSIRPMLDVKEFDRRDDSQDIALGTTRADPYDLFWGDPVGISGATSLKPGAFTIPPPAGSPYTVTSVPGVEATTNPWKAPADIAVAMPMVVTLDWPTSDTDDWDLKVEKQQGEDWVEVGSSASSPGVGPEIVSFVFEPGATYHAVATNYTSVSPTGTVTVAYDSGAIPQFAASGTRNDDRQQTGWQITNIRPNNYFGLAHAAERAYRPIVVDLIKHTDRTSDVSGDFVQPASKTPEPVLAGKNLLLSTRMYNHGGKAVKGATLSLYDRDPSTGAAPIVTVVHDLGAYERKNLTFNYTPKLGLNELWVRTTAPGDLEPGNDVVRSELTAYPAGAADLLLVDNDRGWNSEEAIEAVLQGLGVRYQLVVGEPSLATLKKYKAVIWTTTTVSGFKGVISPAAIDAMQGYLDGGGKLWFQTTRGMFYLFAPDRHARPEFLAGYFGLVATNNLLGSMGQAIRIGNSSSELKTLNLGYLDGRPYLDYGELATEGVKGKVEALYKHSLRPDNVIATRVTGKGFRTVYSPPLGVILDARSQVAFAEESLRFLGVPFDKASVAAPSIKFNRFRFVQDDQAWKVDVGAVAPGGVSSVELMYRPHGTLAWNALTLNAVGDGLYQGTIPRQKVPNNGLEYFARMTTTAGQIVSTGDNGLMPNLASGSYGTPAAAKYGRCAAKVAGVKITRPAPAPNGLPATGVGSGTTGFVALGVALGAGLWLRRRRTV